MVMNLRLLGTTILAMGLPLMASNGAQAAEKIELSLGGYWHGIVTYGRQSDGLGQPGANIRDHGFGQESEIQFTGRTTLDNGISFGVNVQLEGESSAD